MYEHKMNMCDLNKSCLTCITAVIQVHVPCTLGQNSCVNGLHSCTEKCIQDVERT